MAKKTGPISKAERFYIQEHAVYDSAAEIARDIDRKTDAVEEVIKELKKSNPEKFDIDTSLAGPAFGKDKKNGVTVSTSAASDIATAIQRGEIRIERGTPGKISQCVTGTKRVD